MQRIVDAHVHLSERKDDALIRFARLNGFRYTIEELLKAMRTNKIARGLLLSPPLKQNIPLPNSEIIRICEKSHGMLAPGITVEPSPRQVNAAIKLAEQNRRLVKGFKIRLGYVNAAADARVFDPVYDYAESEQLPVLFHTGDTAFSRGDLTRSHPLSLDRVANKRERLIIILCHFGNPWFEEAAELIYKHPNVYADTSGLITGERAYSEEYSEMIARKISEAVYYASGADKIIFGTDYPVTRHSDALALVKKLQIDRRDKEKILWRNAERVFQL